MKILVTSTSFQDTPGKHHEILKSKGFDLDFKRGPLSEQQLLGIEWKYDGIVMGDDEYTYSVLQKAKAGGLKILSKYGVGLDKVNLKAAKELGIEVRNCPGLNHTTVAEHVFALLLSYCRNIVSEVHITRSGDWKRFTGIEITGKKIAIIGLGKIGKEVARIAKCFSMQVLAYDKFIDKTFCSSNDIQVINDLNQELQDVDFISLHCNLDESSRGLISHSILFNGTKNDVVIINTARAHLVDRESLTSALKEKKINGYLADVWYEEPILKDDPLKDFKNVIITPHIASRTFDNVEKQGIMSVENLCGFLGV